MVLLLKLIYKTYHDLTDYYYDPRTKDFFLSNNIFVLLALIAVYHQFVTKWGPKYMKNRPPFELKTALTAYNVLQVVLSIRIFYLGSRYLYIFGNYSLRCQPVDYSNSEIGIMAAKEVHKFFLVKVLDLCDTVFFVLRKKQKQVTFLHLYHHIGMVCMTWIGVRFIPGGHVCFIGYVNSIVHAFMYSYYLMALYKHSSQIWWKKYMTVIQIIQFSVLTLQWAVMLIGPNCGFPKFMGFIFFPQNLFMMTMFLNFYYKTYIKVKNVP